MSSTLSAAPQRDEAKASRFLYCAGLDSYWANASKAKQPDSHDVATWRNASDDFWEASVLFSDEQFVRAHKSEVLQHIHSVLTTASQDNGVRLKSVGDSCDRALHDEVVPLLKAENLIPGDAFDTTVPVLHVADVTRDIVEWHAMRHPDCKFEKVVGAQIIKREKDGVTEHWTIQACDGKKFIYSVGVLPAEGGVTDFVGDVETPTEKSHKP